MGNDLSPAERDILIRTVIGEAGNDASAPAVAHVVLNRLGSGGYGSNVPSVVFAPNQFEAWSRQGPQLLNYAPTSPPYQSAAKIVDDILAGKTPDPTDGATKFYSPGAQKALGRAPPKWDDGTGLQIGAHKFFGGGQQVASDFMQDFEIAPAKKAGASSPVPATPAGAGQSDFLTDFQIAPAKSGTSARAAPAASPISVNDSARALATGVPIIGGLLNKADAATNALLAPVLNPLFSESDRLKGATFGERYTNALQQQEGMDTKFATEHPIANTALNVTGGVASTIPAMMAAPAAFGLSRTAGLVPNALASAGTGAVIGGADAGIRTGGDLSAMGHSALFGGGLGFAAPLAGKLIGSGINSLSNAFSRTTPAARNVADVLSEAGLSPVGARNALARMGPNATLADIDPALTTEAGGLASLGGAPTSILKGAMGARAAQADNRVATAIDQALGPKPDLTAARDAIYEQAQKLAGPHYDAARANPSAMDSVPVLSYIDGKLKGAVGGVADVLSTAKGYLTRETVSLPGADGKAVKMIVPKDDPQSLLSARQALDDYIERRGGADTTAGKNALREASAVRSRLDEVLKSDPNIAAGDAAFSGQMKLKDAMDQGVELFTRGVRREDFMRTLAAMSPGEVDALRHGARVAIGDALEQARRGTLTGAQSMFAKASANRAKLDALFPKAGDVFDMLHGEASMRATEQRVAHNSATAERAAVQQKYAPSSEPGMSAAVPLFGHAVGGDYGAIGAVGAKALFSSARNALTESARNRLIEGTARGLSATGPQQAAFLDHLERAFRIGHGANALAHVGSAAANLLTRTGGNALAQQMLPPIFVDQRARLKQAMPESVAEP